MNITSILKLATASVAFSVSAHAVEVFKVVTNPTFPTRNNFLNSVNDIYDTTDVGNGSGFSSGITYNFNGPDTVDGNGVTVPSNSEINPGDQRSVTNGQGVTTATTTYFGPTFYAGIARDLYKGAAGVVHSGGNGYRIRVNNVTQAAIDAENSGNDLNFKAVFLFDADASVLGENQVFRFGDTDTLIARLALPRNMGLGTSTSVASVTIDAGGTFDATSNDPITVLFSDPELVDGVAATVETVDVVMNAEGTAVESITITTAGTGYTSAPTVTFVGGGVTVQPTATIALGAATSTGGNGRASLATYRPMIKAGEEYYAGPLYTVDLTSIETAGLQSHVYTIDDTVGGSTVWTLMPDFESSAGGLQTAATHPNNLTVIDDGTETTVLGSAVENITQVGFLLETSSSVNTGGYNFGVREFTANATSVDLLVDTDGDGVGDDDDVHPGFNDASLATYLNDTWVNATNLDTWLTANNYSVGDGSTGGLTEQDLIDLRVGSTLIAVSDGSATVSLQMEESQDLSSWSDLGAAVPFTVTLDPSDDSQFLRVNLAD